MNLPEYILLAASSLFIIVDPVATAPVFVAMTPTDTPAQRAKRARLACVVATIVLLTFAVAGRVIFKFLGLTMPAFQIAASIVLLMVALDMLQAQRSRVRETDEETEAGTGKDDISITPLAIPLLAGPGAISTVIVLQNQARGIAQHAALFVVVTAVMFASYLILRFAAHGTKFLNPIAIKIIMRVMGLLLAAVAVQFMLNALQELKPGLLGS
ncbi:MAG TPA: MarC family protein [Verrucomicrobiota bacterium]|nr:MarC family protein [Verrucomicrobiota bacterium]HQB15183.1 MarC family protein [Verrucomicrobiota bacterium]